MAALFSTITCPECGTAKREPMPENACVWFYRCTNCDVTLRPKPGDCCVFCSYGDTPCPPQTNCSPSNAARSMMGQADPLPSPEHS